MKVFSRARALQAGAAAALLVANVPAIAAPQLLATGTLTGSSAGVGVDLSGLTGLLENGQPGNILGGMGSGLAWAGNNTFIGTPDRGPNALPYNSAVDNTVSYIARFQTISMALTPNAGPGLAYNLTPTLVATTLLSSPTALTYGTGAGLGVGSGVPALNATNSTNYFTGRSDNFNPALNSGNPNNARLDPEGVRVSPDGKYVYISDEYGPYLYKFDRATGARVAAFTLPNNLNITNLSPVGATEIANNTVGRVTNKGMEGLAITPDGKTLVGVMQAALEQDAAIAATTKMIRIVTVDTTTGVTHEYGYLLTTGSGVSEITAINDHEFLVDERDGNGLGNGNNVGANGKVLYKINLAGATDITGLTGAAALAAVVAKTQFLNLGALLNANGISNANIPAKIEGLAFGDDIINNGVLTHTLWVANDNDFNPITSAGGPGAGPSLFYVIGVTDADLGGSVFVAQATPEPASLALLGIGLAGLAYARGRRRCG